MKAAILLFAILSATPAHSFTCQEVRAYVAKYGRARALAFALSHGATWAQIKEARRCLRSDGG